MTVAVEKIDLMSSLCKLSNSGGADSAAATGDNGDHIPRLLVVNQRSNFFLL